MFTSRQILIFCLFFAACLSQSFASPVDELIEANRQGGNFCGTNSLYIALNLLGEVPENYEKLLTSFPNVKEEGCSLASLKAYLDKKTNLHSRPLFRTDKQIFELDGKKTVAVVLVEREPIAHVFLMQPIDGNIQVIDFPHHWKMTPADFDKKKKIMLLISKEPIPEDRNFLLYVSGICFILSLTLFVHTFISKRIKEKRNSPKEEGLAT